MNKILKTTAIAAALLLTLSGCGISLDSGDAESSEAPSTETEKSQSGSNEDASTSDDSALTDSAECMGGEPILLESANAAVTFTGDCGDVTISANSVTAEFEQVGNVSITGDTAAVTVAGSAQNIEMLGSSNTFAGDETGSLNIGGTTNTATAASATEVSVSGSLNTVSWQGGASEGSDSGTNNTLVGPAK